MLDPADPLAELLRRDRRYHFDAYVFIFEALRFAQERLNMGRVAASSPSRDALDQLIDEEAAEFDDGPGDDGPLGENALDELNLGANAGADDADEPEQHVSGQDLCEAIRQYALSQYGLLARSVLDHWGVHSTGDFGEIVFNLIEIGKMKKTSSDRREDFDDVYDFARALADDGAVFANRGVEGGKGSSD
ncbi:MAG: Minf_1886 family protein [Planctomycetota bacterium]